jgi:hypothetical protein
MRGRSLYRGHLAQLRCQPQLNTVGIAFGNDRLHATELSNDVGRLVRVDSSHCPDSLAQLGRLVRRKLRQQHRARIRVEAAEKYCGLPKVGRR